ncbi:hypothetical protein SBRCBS47491_003990 [Sporothrix bragantina]|uniref:Zn(2)-C6 fungal-type domain-containing protein n=1 Tax=Sporothrix bragantina TaxID=671064 RepID=A0ABP0BK08_9PEZI
MSEKSSVTASSSVVPQKKRIRAVVACSHCRSKRSKCDGIPGQQACTQCQQRGIECEMSDGKRNRGHYKPQAEALAKRVRLLEEALAEARAANQELLARQHGHGHYPQPHHQQPQQQHHLPDNPFAPWEHMDMDDAASSVVPPPSSVFAMPPDIDVDAHSMILSGAGPGPVTTIAESLAPSSSMPPPSTHNFSMHHHHQQQHHARTHSQSHHQMMDHNSRVMLGGGAGAGGGGAAATPSQPTLEQTTMQPPPNESEVLAATFAAAVAAAPFPTVNVRPRAPCCDLDLSPPLVDYLLGLFFHRYQMMMKFVSQQDFITLHQTNNPEHLSTTKAAAEDGTSPHDDDEGELYNNMYNTPSRGGVHHSDCCHKHRSALFLAMLAAGLRYSTRADVTNRFLRPDGENKLATAARRAIETEIGRPTLATVQTVLILCEVETSLDNQMTGYMYSCLASKLIFEMGLDLGSCTSSSALTAEETAIRHWLVWAASVHDQFWAVFLRRPLAIKNRTLQLSRLAWRFAGGSTTSTVPQMYDNQDGHDGTANDDGLRPPPSFEDEVNDDLMDLMELAREITDELYGAGSPYQQRPTAAQAAAAAAAAVAAEAAEAAEKAKAAEKEKNAAGGGAGAATSSSSPSYDGGYSGGGLPHTYHQHAAQRHAHSQLPDVASLDTRLNQWFNSLSDRVRKGPISGHDCYHFMFVLHLHFNATKIILHRTRALPPGRRNSPSAYPLQSPVTPGSGVGGAGASSSNNTHQQQNPHYYPHQQHAQNGSSTDYAAVASMATLGHASICIAKLFETFRRREDIRTLQCTGVQWAAMASEALTWYIETLPIDGAIEAVAHLQSLSRTLKDMTRTFLPAVYPYNRTNHALRMFQRRIDGAESPPPIKGQQGQQGQSQQQQQQQQQQHPQSQQQQQHQQPPQRQAQAQPNFDMTQVYIHSHQSMHHHPSFHGLDEMTASSLPDLSTGTTTVPTTAYSVAGTNNQHPAPSLFEADAASVAAGAEGSVSVVSLSAVTKDLGQHGHAHPNQHHANHQQHPMMAGLNPDAWAGQDTWDWDDLLERQ